jgi:hypothetical protein
MAKEFAPLIDCWFKALFKIRVLKFNVSKVTELPESMGNSRHLRYLCLLGGSKPVTLPSSVCRLYHLKNIERVNSDFGKIPPGFSDAISLQKIKSKSFTYNKDCYDKLSLKWIQAPNQEMMDNQMEVIPHWNIQQLDIEGYGGESCASWFRPNLLPRLRSLEIKACHKFMGLPFFGPLEGSLDNAAGLENINRPEELVQGFSSLTRIRISECTSLASIPLHVWSSNFPYLEDLDIGYCTSLTSIGVCGASSSTSGGSGVKGFSSLARINIWACDKLLSLDELLTPAYLPVLKTVRVRSCEELASLSVDRLDLVHDLEVEYCPKLNPQRVMTFPSSLKKLCLRNCQGIESININNSQLRSYSELEQLIILNCSGLKSIGGATAIDKIMNVLITGCTELKEIQQPVSRGCP